MKIRTPDWLNKLGSVFEDAADDIEEVAYELRDSFAVEAIRAGIVIALTGIKKCPVIPSGFIVGLPGGVEIAVMGIRPRHRVIVRIHQDSTLDKERDTRLLFHFRTKLHQSGP